MIKITFPDGSIKEFESGILPIQIAESISPQLKKEVVACSIDGQTTELNRPITKDASIKFFFFFFEEGDHTFLGCWVDLLGGALLPP